MASYISYDTRPTVHLFIQGVHVYCKGEINSCVKHLRYGMTLFNQIENLDVWSTGGFKVRRKLLAENTEIIAHDRGYGVKQLFISTEIPVIPVEEKKIEKTYPQQSWVCGWDVYKPGSEEGTNEPAGFLISYIGVTGPYRYFPFRDFQGKGFPEKARFTRNSPGRIVGAVAGTNAFVTTESDEVLSEADCLAVNGEWTNGGADPIDLGGDSWDIITQTFPGTEQNDTNTIILVQWDDDLLANLENPYDFTGTNSNVIHRVATLNNRDDILNEAGDEYYTDTIHESGSVIEYADYTVTVETPGGPVEVPYTVATEYDAGYRHNYVIGVNSIAPGIFCGYAEDKLSCGYYNLLRDERVDYDHTLLDRRVLGPGADFIDKDAMYPTIYTEIVPEQDVYISTANMYGFLNGEKALLYTAQRTVLAYPGPAIVEDVGYRCVAVRYYDNIQPVGLYSMVNAYFKSWLVAMTWKPADGAPLQASSKVVDYPDGNYGVEGMYMQMLIPLHTFDESIPENTGGGGLTLKPQSPRYFKYETGILQEKEVT